MKSSHLTQTRKPLDTVTIDDRTSAPITTTTELLKAIRPDPVAFAAASLPRDLQCPNFETTYRDVERLIHTLAVRYTDMTCVQLHTDELVGDLHEKYAKLIAHKDIFQFPTRSEFFKYVKTVLNNHIKGLVHKYRRTEKRTGISTAARRAHEYGVKFDMICETLHKIESGDTLSEAKLAELRDLGLEPTVESLRHAIECATVGSATKPVEISLDDEDAHLQVGDESSCYDTISEREQIEHIEAHLNPIERFVFQQLRMQPPEAAIYMELDGARGRKTGANYRKLNADVILARGVGLSYDVWEQLVSQVQRKVLSLMNEDAPLADEVQYNRALSELEQVFGVQVPRSLDPKDVRRLFTVCAREQFNKVGHDERVQENLKAIGALIPETHGLTMVCFAVLYNPSEKVCQACQVADQCKQSASHFGFDEIPYLTNVAMPHSGDRRVDAHTRTAYLLPVSHSPRTDTISDSDPVPSVVRTERDVEIMHWLDEHCRGSVDDRAGHRPQKLYRVSAEGTESVIFSQFVQSADLELRICAPSEELKKKLILIKNGYYLPSGIPASEAIQILDRHAKEKCQHA